MANIDVSVIILNFNTREILLNCLASLRASKKPSDRWEVFVVDNASTDGSIETLDELVKSKDSFYSGLHIIKNEKNIGFAAGNNKAIAVAQGKHILLLNSDTEVSAGVIDEMVSFLDAHPKAGVATCKVVLSDGSIDPACHRGFPTPWASLTYVTGLEKLFPHSKLFAQYHLGYLPLDKPHKIDSPVGAFFLVKRQVISDVDMLDEDYFMYGEDLDWSYRIKQKGWEVWYNPSVSIVHLKKQSGRSNVDKKLRKRTQRFFYETMWLFYSKHYKRHYPALVTFFVWLAIHVRILLLGFSL